MNSKIIYLEELSFWNLIFSFIGSIKYRQGIKVSRLSIYYIDATLPATKYFIPILKKFGVSVNKLNFEMRDIRDENGELIRIRIPRNDLFEFRNKLYNSKVLDRLSHESWNQGRIAKHINKGIIDGGIMDEKSVSRVLFIIEVVNWHMRQNVYREALFYINKRPWLGIYKEYAAKYNVELYNTSTFRIHWLHKSTLQGIVRKYPWLYGKIKNIKYGKLTNVGNSSNLHNKLYVDGRGDVNLENDGNHSDFFWYLNSAFPAKNILYQYHSDAEKEYLTNHGIASTRGNVLLGKCRYSKPKLKGNGKYSEESKVIETILTSYHLQRYYWYSFFQTYNVKIFFTWYKYTNDHMAISDAIGDCGGISAVWQMAFDGYEAIECETSADIVFSSSKFSHTIEEKLGSRIKYHILTGYSKDYVGPIVRKEAQNVRERLQANGAKRIIFVIDENSIDDVRWHTGHTLQRENYQYVLEKVLDTPWLGAIFKPKAAKTLRARLGIVADLLTKAERTGRCYIYEASGRYTTSAPPILAGLSADVCIHAHLCSGTAALECALEGLPTLLIDREGCPYSKLHKLPKGKVIFKNWRDTIDAVMEHFQTEHGIPGFGDWSSIIDELDPFRDGMAASRMGTFLHWLIQGFELGLNKEEIMASAVRKYREQWGNNKVLSI